MAQFRETINKKQIYDPTTGQFRDAIGSSQVVYDPTMNSVSIPASSAVKTSSAPKQSTTKSAAAPTEQTPQEQAPTATPSVPQAPDYSAYAYDSSTNAAYNSAMAALEAAKGNLPQYAGTYDAQLDSLYQEIVGRGKFNYNLNEDMFYQQAADRYQNMGQMAMMDTMGQAAALTGGYGNTYAQNVGQQAYQGYLQQLNDNIPQYYQMALDAHNAEGDQLMQQYGMLGDLANREYGMFQDDLANYWQNVNYQQGIADAEYARGYENWYNAQQMGNSTQNQNYDRLVSMMTTMGYKPSPEEIAAAGMNPNQAQAFMDYYQQQNGGPGRPETPDSKITAEDVKNAALGMVGAYVGDSEVASYLHQAVSEGAITEEERKQIQQVADAARKQNPVLYNKPTWLY